MVGAKRARCGAYW